MKRRILIKFLEDHGYSLVRNGGSHDLYSNGVRVETIPRHSDINEKLAKAIMKKVKGS